MTLPLHPKTNGAVSLAYTTSSTSVEFRGATGTGVCTIIVSNAGTGDLFFAVGDNTITTAIPSTYGAIGGQHVPPGAVLTFTVSGAYIAIIGTASGTAYINHGEGN